MKRIYNIIFILLLSCVTSCIENDLSYPDVDVEIMNLSVDGAKEIDINYEDRKISILLSETVEISSVRFIEFKLAEGCSFIEEFPKVIDLSEPYKFKMKVYQDEQWTITAAQPIERYIRCDNQVGDAIIDVEQRIAYVKVVETQSLSAVKINEMKLEREGSVVTHTYGFVFNNGQSQMVMEECSFPMVLDCSVSRRFTVYYKGEDIEWNVIFLAEPIAVGMKSVNAWTYSAELQGVTNGKGNPVFQYKESSASSWNEFSSTILEGTTLSGTLTGLSEDTEYVVRVSNGTDTSEEMTFRTGKAEQLENMDFEQWHQGDPHDCWYPYAAGGNDVWGTANPGTNFVSTVNPSRPEYEHVVKGTAVRLESVKALGVFAAGNIFSGRFLEFSFSTMSAYLEWGAPFTSRPYSLKGWVDYAPKIIDITQDKISGKPNPYKDLKGTMDNMQILAVLVAEAENEVDKGPFPVVSSKPGVPDLLNDPRVIAFGTIESSENTGGNYKEFECVMNYKDNRTPAYVIVVACSSLRGNFFTGALGSVLYVDEFHFEYK